MQGMEHRIIRRKKLDNFRFKTYLKSNLEALYRNKMEKFVWQDRMGTSRTDAEQLAANKAFPMLVNKIYTNGPSSDGSAV